MKQFSNRLVSAAIGVTLVGVLGGCQSVRNEALSPPVSKQAFTTASIILEHNATDDDAEIVIFIKGGEEGLVELRVFAPDGSKILDLSTDENIVGLRECAIESAEPGVASVTGAYPEGRYCIEGRTIGGQEIRASADLSHGLPSPPQLKVDTAAGTVAWSLVSGAAKYSIELEQEVNGEDVMSLTMELPQTVSSFLIPKRFQSRGDYQVGIAIHHANGNITVVEKEFSIK